MKKPVHIFLSAILVVLLSLCLAGTAKETKSKKLPGFLTVKEKKAKSLIRERAPGKRTVKELIDETVKHALQEPAAKKSKTVGDLIRETVEKEFKGKVSEDDWELMRATIKKMDGIDINGDHDWDSMKDKIKKPVQEAALLFDSRRKKAKSLIRERVNGKKTLKELINETVKNAPPAAKKSKTVGDLIRATIENEYKGILSEGQWEDVRDSIKKVDGIDINKDHDWDSMKSLVKTTATTTSTTTTTTTTKKP